MIKPTKIIRTLDEGDEKKERKKRKKRGKIGRLGVERYHYSIDDETTSKMELQKQLDKLIKFYDKSGYWILGYFTYKLIDNNDGSHPGFIFEIDQNDNLIVENLNKKDVSNERFNNGNIVWTLYKTTTKLSLLRTLKIENKNELLIYSLPKEIHIRHILQNIDDYRRDRSYFSNGGVSVPCRDYFLRPITKNKYNKLIENGKYFRFMNNTRLEYG